MFIVGEVEEVFAEDYDEPKDDHGNHHHGQSPHEDDERDQLGSIIHEAIDCPNKWNKWHTCVDYCVDRYGYKKFRHLLSLEKKRDRLLRKYPLPSHWIEVGDPDT